MTKYEYCVYDYELDSLVVMQGELSEKSALDGYGRVGWELVAVTRTKYVITYYFRRKLRKEANRKHVRESRPNLQ